MLWETVLVGNIAVIIVAAAEITTAIVILVDIAICIHIGGAGAGHTRDTLEPTVVAVFAGQTKVIFGLVGPSERHRLL